MKVLFISKYATFKETSQPSRQYFLSSELAKNGNNVMLVGSRSVSPAPPFFWGIKKTILNNRLQLVLMNGPDINLGFSAKRILSWMVFEFCLLVNTRLFFKFKPQVIVVSSLSILTVLYGVLIKKLFKIPLVVEIRDIYPLTLVDFGKFSRESLVVRVLGWIERFGYHNSDLLISPLENFGMHAASIVGEDVNFKWLPMGYDNFLLNCNLSDDSKNIIEDVNSFRDLGYFVVAYAGSHGFGDRLELILDVAAALDGLKIKFIFIGHGPVKRDLMSKYKRLNNISFYKPIPKTDVVNVLSNCSLLINLWHNVSLYRFGVSPNKWIDYSLAKRPFLVYLPFSLEIAKIMPNCFVINDDSVVAISQEILRISEISSNDLDLMGVNGYAYVVKNLPYRKIAVDLDACLRKLVVPR